MKPSGSAENLFIQALLEPLIVKYKTFEVVEGNSRLAVYRLCRPRLENDTAVPFVMAGPPRRACITFTLGVLGQAIFILSRLRQRNQLLHLIEKQLGNRSIQSVRFDITA